MNNKDFVRLLLGDTDTSDTVFSDSEILEFLDRRSVVSNGSTTSVNVYAAAADAASAAAGLYARDFNFSEDGQQFSRAQRVGQFLELERSLRVRAGGVSVPVGTQGTVPVS